VSEPRSYYGEPVIAEPVWNPEIPVYFFVGGVAGASAPLTLAASLRGNDALARRAAAIALVGSAVSAGLLVKDLGRPERFLNMLRMFKVSSPMSVGSWVLTGFGATAAASAGRELLGVLPRPGRAAQVAGAGLGPLLSTYTATLIANTAVPVWHEARRELPFVFGASAVGTAGALATLVTPPHDAAPARRMLVGGAVAELAAVQAMERRLGAIGKPDH
jgi:formate-dependent nitrite reductase membrane component NrfD